MTGHWIKSSRLRLEASFLKIFVQLFLNLLLASPRGLASLFYSSTLVPLQHQKEGASSPAERHAPQLCTDMADELLASS